MVLAILPTLAIAEPWTDHFDALIEELQVRSVALSNSTDKVERKQKKAVDKMLSSLLGKDSSSLATDIKNAGKLAKKLQKTFPSELNSMASAVGPIGGDGDPTLQSLLEELFDDLGDDIQSVLGEAQEFLDAQGASKCKDKAQSALDATTDALAAAESATDFADRARALGTAAKNVARAESRVDDAANCKGSGISTVMATVNDVPLDAQGNDNVQAFYYPDSNLIELDITFSNGDFLFMLISLTDPHEGTHPFTNGAEYTQIAGGTQFNSTSGQLIITKLESSEKELSCSFSFTASAVDTTAAGNASSIVVNGEGSALVVQAEALFFHLQTIHSP